MTNVASADRRVVNPRDSAANQDLLGPRLLVGAVPLAARLLLVAEFLIALNGKLTDWQSQADFMAARGMQHVPLLLGAAAAVELVGSVGLILGYRASAAASMLFVYLGVVTFRLHAFWQLSGLAAGANMTQFFKNLGMMGGLLMVARHGPGSWSLDRWRATRLSRDAQRRLLGSAVDADRP